MWKKHDNGVRGEGQKLSGAAKQKASAGPDVISDALGRNLTEPKQEVEGDEKSNGRLKRDTLSYVCVKTQECRHTQLDKGVETSL